MYAGRLHFACREIRLAIAVLDTDVDPDETTIARLERAREIISEVQRELVK